MGYIGTSATRHRLDSFRPRLARAVTERRSEEHRNRCRSCFLLCLPLVTKQKTYQLLESHCRSPRHMDPPPGARYDRSLTAAVSISAAPDSSTPSTPFICTCEYLQAWPPKSNRSASLRFIFHRTVTKKAARADGPNALVLRIHSTLTSNSTSPSGPGGGISDPMGGGSRK